jgi:hypothetical protein
MKKLITILFIILSLSASAQFGYPFAHMGTRNPLTTAPQRATENYIELLSLNITQATAARTASQSLENAGIYDSILLIADFNHWTGTKAYNFVCPFDFDEAFTVQVSSGDVTTSSNGIVLNSTSDLLNTFFVNDFATDAPDLSVYWYVSSSVSSQMISSTSPFNFFSREGDGNAYINIWAGSSAIAVPEPSAGFNGGGRYGSSVFAVQGSTRYSATYAINSQNPAGNYTYLKGASSAYVIEFLVICRTLSPAKEAQLKSILDTWSSQQ